MKAEKAKSQRQVAWFCGLIIGGCYGAALTQCYQQERDRRLAKDAAVAHRQYQLSRDVEMLGNTARALAEKVGISEDELTSRAHEIWNQRIEEAVHGKTS